MILRTARTWITVTCVCGRLRDSSPSIVAQTERVRHERARDMPCIGKPLLTDANFSATLERPLYPAGRACGKSQLLLAVQTKTKGTQMSAPSTLSYKPFPVCRRKHTVTITPNTTIGNFYHQQFLPPASPHKPGRFNFTYHTSNGQ